MINLMNYSFHEGKKMMINLINFNNFLGDPTSGDGAGCPKTSSPLSTWKTCASNGKPGGVLTKKNQWIYMAIVTV
jgi:hypothetical protein